MYIPSGALLAPQILGEGGAEVSARGIWGIHVKGMIYAATLALAVAGISFSGTAIAETKPPLYDPIQTGDVAGVRAALQNGADVNATYNGETMLNRAIREKDAQITKILLAAPGIDVNKRGTFNNDMGSWTRTPLILASAMGKTEIVSTLLKMGAAVNTRDISDDMPESRGSTALIKAAQYRHADAIRLLVTEAKGIDLNAKNRFGHAAIWYAAEAEDLASVKLLCEHGAAVNIADNEGESILTTTFLHKNRAVLDYLVSKGADINRVSGKGLTPLDAAILSLKGEDGRTIRGFIDYFLSFKPNLDLQKSLPGGLGGVPALHLAAQFGHADMVALLLDHGASIDLKSQARGATALHYAVFPNEPDAAKVLIKRKANLEIADLTGATPITMATQLHRSEIVRLLSDAGAKPANVKTYGVAPSSLAPNAAPSVSADKLFGTWSGTQDGISYAVMILTLNKAGTYSFTSKFTAAALKTYPSGVNPIIAAHQGSYAVSGDVLTLSPSSAAPVAMRWVMDNGVLVLDGKTRMKKGK
ncbi:hypothetical protein GCM10008941_31970 [Rhizomicrobium palustre]